jgi:hypothetical protein
MHHELGLNSSGEFATVGGVDSAHISNNKQDTGVLLSTNGSSGSSGNTGTTDGHHDHENCLCPHVNTSVMPVSENQNYPCCVCGQNGSNVACTDCDCQLHNGCLEGTTYDSVLPNNETLSDSTSSGEAPSGSDNGEAPSGSDSGSDSSSSGEAPSGSDSSSSGD